MLVPRQQRSPERLAKLQRYAYRRNQAIIWAALDRTRSCEMTDWWVAVISAASWSLYLLRG